MNPINKGLLIAALDMMARNGHDVVFIDAGGAVVDAGLVDAVKEIDARGMVKAIRITREHDWPDAPYKCYAEPRRSKSDRKRDPKWRRK